MLKIPGSTQIAVRLDGEMVAAIDQYAKRYGVNRSDAIRELLGVGLQEFRLLQLQDIVTTPPVNEA